MDQPPIATLYLAILVQTLQVDRKLSGHNAAVPYMSSYTSTALDVTPKLRT